MKVKKYDLFLRETGSFDTYDLKMTDAEELYRFAIDTLHMDEFDREHVVAIALDVNLGVIGYNIASVGTLDASYVSPREIMKFLILSNAAGLMLLHNHPSGDASASIADIEVTERMSDACDVMGIKMLEHMVIGNGCYESLRSFIREGVRL